MSKKWKNNFVRIKICGLANNALEVAQSGIDYAGFIFYAPSPRFVEGKISPEVFQSWPSEVWRVGVFVNAKTEEILNMAKTYGLGVIQLHGSESVEQCTELQTAGFTVIKVFGVGEHFDFAVMADYVSCVDFFLFDTKVSQHGGSGKAFDWQFLTQYPFDVPFFVGGGVGVENLPDLLKMKLPMLHAVDLNSKLEISPGLKDLEQVRKAVSIVLDRNKAAGASADL